MENKPPVFFELTRRLDPDETIRQGDWVEWAYGAWTRVAEGSVFINHRADYSEGAGGVLHFRRDLEVGT